MIEKRFVADNEYVMQDNQVWVVCGGEHSADVVATALNELIDENVELDTKCSQLEKENEQLKQFIKELTSRDGKIWLSSGYVYDVKKVLKDGDVE